MTCKICEYCTEPFQHPSMQTTQGGKILNFCTSECYKTYVYKVNEINKTIDNIRQTSKRL